jgi:hypothetical protein
MLHTSIFVWAIRAHSGSFGVLHWTENRICPHFPANSEDPHPGCHASRFGTQFALLRSLATVKPEQEFPKSHKEHDNEGKDECKAGNQDRDSDGSNGRYLHRSKLSADFRGRRWPASPVPAAPTELLNYSAAAELARQEPKARALVEPDHLDSQFLG